MTVPRSVHVSISHVLLCAEHARHCCVVQTLCVSGVSQSSVVSAEGTRMLHEKAQSALQQHLMMRASDRAQEQHQQALMAQINTDMELLLSKDSAYYCYS